MGLQSGSRERALLGTFGMEVHVRADSMLVTRDAARFNCFFFQWPAVRPV